MRIRAYLLVLLLSVLILFAGCDFLLDMFPDSDSSISQNEPTEPIPSPDEEDGNAYLGYPSAVDLPNTQLIERDAYTLLYSYEDLIPLWVSWHLDQEERGVGRDESFKGDPDIPKDYRVLTSDYTNSKFDRGHVCPNADRSGIDSQQEETFYMSNIIPQNPKNNRETWQSLEAYLQGYADSNSEIYIIAGPAGCGGYNEDGEYKEYIEADINGKTKQITVPEYVWKIAVIMNDDRDYNGSDNDDIARMGEIGGCDVLAVLIPNEDTSNKEWWNFICTVNEIENITGYDFFNTLDQSLENDLESEIYEVANL